jgi:hypothetical protein
MGFLLRNPDQWIKEIKAFNDADLRSEISDNESKIKELMERFFHCG